MFAVYILRHWMTCSYWQSSCKHILIYWEIIYAYNHKRPERSSPQGSVPCLRGEIRTTHHGTFVRCPRNHVCVSLCHSSNWLQALVTTPSHPDNASVWKKCYSNFTEIHYCCEQLSKNEINVNAVFLSNLPFWLFKYQYEIIAQDISCFVFYFSALEAISV